MSFNNQHSYDYYDNEQDDYYHNNSHYDTTYPDQDNNQYYTTNNNPTTKVSINELLQNNTLQFVETNKYKLIKKLTLYSNQELVVNYNTTIEIPYEFTLHLKQMSVLSNYGIISNDGRIYNHGIINNYNKLINNHKESKIRNYGTLNNMFKSTLENNYLLENSNVLYNDGFIHNKPQSDFINSSNAMLNNNQGKIYIDGEYILEGKLIENNKVYIKRI